MLVHDISRPEERRNGATVAVLLHGRGSHRGDLQAIRPLVPEDWFLVTPQAPHPGHPWGYGPGWAWYRYLSDDQVDEVSLEQSMNTLDHFLEELPERIGVRPGRIALGGFSQGGTVSMAYALSRPGRVAGIVNFSGFLPRHVEVPFSALSPTTVPIFWGHGFRDPNIPHVLADRGRGRLLQAGVPLQARDYDIGHWIAPEEVADAVDFVSGVE